MDIARFPRIRLGHFPTPLEPMDNLSRLLGGPRLWIKRDDCTGLSTGGNKTRKLEFLLAEAVAQQADVVITQGATQSNHARQTAAAAAKLGMGCHILLEAGDGPAMIFDIGGGSTELVLVEAGGAAEASRVPRILDWQSVPWGVVSLTDTVGRSEEGEDTRIARYAKMRQLVSDSFAPFAARVAESAGHPDIRLLGTSGTVTTLASLYLELPSYDRRAVDGLIVPAAEMREISARLSVMTPYERSTLPCIGQDRADLVVAGCAILEAILDLWPARRLGVADRGIREGILRSLMAAERRSERSLRALQQQRGGKAGR